MIEGLSGLALLAMVAWYWQDSLAAREIAIAAAQRACEADNVQFLDDTVAQRGLRLVRSEDGRLRLQRSFVFEFSCTGDDRQPGSVVLLGHVVTMLYTGPHQRDDLPFRLH